VPYTVEAVRDVSCAPDVVVRALGSISGRSYLATLDSSFDAPSRSFDAIAAVRANVEGMYVGADEVVAVTTQYTVGSGADADALLVNKVRARLRRCAHPATLVFRCSTCNFSGHTHACAHACAHA
jgi:hypothetical protein